MKIRALWPLALTLIACDTVDEPGSLEIAGTYHSAFGGVETFSDSMFPFGGTVVDYDNDENFAITQNAADAMFNANKFSKFVWTEPMNGRFFYCVVIFDAETSDAAKNTSETADASDPSTTGCAGFPWTELGPLLEIEGTFDNNFGGMETITSDNWDASTVREYDNDNNVLYLQLPDDDMFNPNKFTRVVWTEPANDSLYYCWVEFGLDTIEAAKTSTATADSTDPDNSGCGGFSWTKLTRR